MGSDDCFECGEPGHLARDCPARLAAAETRAPKPLWCGNCDKETRLVYGIVHGEYLAMRCTRCHPLRFVPLKHHRRCGGCNMIVYTWDQSPCALHLDLAV